MLHNKKSFTKGVLLLGSFAVVFVLILTPIFKTDRGVAENGLSYADDLFNKLSKGSSYFIPEVREKIAPIQGAAVDVTIKPKKAELAGAMIALGAKAGLTLTEKAPGELTVKGDLPALLAAAIEDADSMYKNDGAAVQSRRGMNEKEAMTAWWEMLNAMIKPLQKQKLIKEAQGVDLVMRKAIEPAFNFYGIPAQRVLDKAGVLTGLLVFYVVYTLWYGFAIFELFDGVGLSMKKAKAKEEV
ncbi:hypothetical protein [Desulfovibrio aminophilus]|uniref:hypothetical protein n=1 Tax=Desulfovibrio aminophilus TaxID=81425 RepID=UPI000412B035|nr:hypothetical protein [Desulfovibrio aminophilus]